MYLQQYEVSMTILDYFYPKLKNYIDFDFTDQLSPPRLKKDGNYYATYVSEIRQEYAVLSPDRCSVVLKEIPASLTEIYRKISSRWSPYIETVYGHYRSRYQSLCCTGDSGLPDTYRQSRYLFSRMCFCLYAHR